MMLTIPPPPHWATDASTTFLARAAEPLYVLLTVSSFLVWGVLRWQRTPGQTAAAKSFRAFVFSKGWLWLVLAVTRWIAPQWRLPLYSLVVVYIAGATVWVLVALVLTYVAPVLRGSNRPERGPLEEVLPVASNGERRVGPVERRSNWPPPTVGA